jgi:hypothetical protein
VTAVTPSREALTAALDAGIREWEDGGGPLLPILERHVRAAVVPLDTLADDEALVEQVAAGTLAPRLQMDDYTREGQELLRRRAQRALRALAAALLERGDR